MLLGRRMLSFLIVIYVFEGQRCMFYQTIGMVRGSEVFQCLLIGPNIQSIQILSYFLLIQIEILSSLDVPCLFLIFALLSVLHVCTAQFIHQLILSFLTPFLLMVAQTSFVKLKIVLSYQKINLKTMNF